MTNISSPTGGSMTTSPIWAIDQKARAAVADWSNASLEARCDAVFAAFVEEFRARGWKYTAGGAPISAPNLLANVVTAESLEAQFPGVGASLDCGRIANMLAICFEALVAPKQELGLANATINGFFCTKQLGAPQAGITGEFSCIDPQVLGNVKTATAGFNMVKRCVFIDHYAIKVGATNKVYDGCLNSTYGDISMVREHSLTKSPTEPGVLMGGGVRYREIRTHPPVGFSAAYERI